MMRRTHTAAVSLIIFWMLASPAPGQDTAGGDRPQDSPENTIRLIVRGDDFGYSHASNLALADSFEKGIMSAASLLVPGPWFIETAGLVRAHPEWPIGIHLTITAEWNRLRWRPILPISEVPSLVAPDGFLYGNGYYHPEPEGRGPDAAPWAERPPNRDEVEKELRAQVRYARQNGVRVDYLDCHMGIACSEDLLPIMEKLSREFCVPLATEAFLGANAVRLQWQQNTRQEAKQLIEQMLQALTPGLWLYVGHPALDTPELRAVDSEVGPDWASRRSAVLETWQDPEVKRIIAERGIQLVSPRDLWDSEKCGLK